MSASTSPAAAVPPPAPEPLADERLAQISATARLLRRPEIGALLAAIVVAIFFWTQNSLFLQLDGIANWTDVASTIGIPAVVVALLMIGGEFDLSAGVMTGSAGLMTGILATEVGMSIWLAIVITLIAATGVGFVNGYMVMKTKLPSFIVTLATFFILQRAHQAPRFSTTSAPPFMCDRRRATWNASIPMSVSQRSHLPPDRKSSSSRRARDGFARMRLTVGPFFCRRDRVTCRTGESASAARHGGTPGRGSSRTPRTDSFGSDRGRPPSCPTTTASALRCTREQACFPPQSPRNHSGQNRTERHSAAPPASDLPPIRGDAMYSPSRRGARPRLRSAGGRHGY